MMKEFPEHARHTSVWMILCDRLMAPLPPSDVENVIFTFTFASPSQGEARYTLGLLTLFVGEKATAVEHLTLASEIYIQHLVSQPLPGFSWKTRDKSTLLKAYWLPNDATPRGAY